MKTILTFLFIVSCNYLFGQRVEKFYTYNWKECEPNEARFLSTILKTDSGYVTADYFIHEKSLQMSGKYNDKEGKVANGYFKYFHPNGTFQRVGKYENGKKEGLWLGYYPNGMLKDSSHYSKGNIIGTSLSWHLNGYLQDSTVVNAYGRGIQVKWFDTGSVASAGYIINGTKPYGTWEFFHKNGRLSSKETYQNEVVINKLYFDENGQTIGDTTNRDRDADFPGGAKAWQKYLAKKVYFPEGFKFMNADKAVVVVSFTINEDGKVEEVDVSTPFYPKFDIIAKNAITGSPDWIPAIKHNRKVKYRMRQLITFVQEDW